MGNKKGQILLITVMLLATVMTVVLSISLKSIINYFGSVEQLNIEVYGG